MGTKHKSDNRPPWVVEAQIVWYHDVAPSHLMKLPLVLWTMVPLSGNTAISSKGRMQNDDAIIRNFAAGGTLCQCYINRDPLSTTFMLHCQLSTPSFLSSRPNRSRYHTIPLHSGGQVTSKPKSEIKACPKPKVKRSIYIFRTISFLDKRPYEVRFHKCIGHQAALKLSFHSPPALLRMKRLALQTWYICSGVAKTNNIVQQ